MNFQTVLLYNSYIQAYVSLTICPNPFLMNGDTS